MVEPDQIQKTLLSLFQDWCDHSPERISQLPIAGSPRRYFRLKAGAYSAIGTWNPDKNENRAFLYFSRQFKAKKLAVPEIYLDRPEQNIYLQEDLGDHSLYHQLPSSANVLFSDPLIEQYKTVLTSLAQLQIIGGTDLDYSYAYPAARFDKNAMRWDLHYFKYFFLKLQDLPFDEQKLEQEFESLVNWLAEASAWHFMHRDCQSRNIMMHDGKPVFIDYQGGREGPAAYDLASLLWQAKARIPFDQREILLEHYLSEAGQLTQIGAGAFRDYYYGIVLLRSLQVLGTYGFRGLVQRKTHFIQSIPFALSNIRWLFEGRHLPDGLDEIKKWIYESSPTFEPSDRKSTDLIVRINSFSFHRGIPEDNSGNGGGYVFDCRPILNPGRFEEYKKLTGLDVEVQQFLKEKSGIDTFLEPVFKLVDQAVQTYLDRNFSHLQINFGCTGGQHRSVFSAELLAERLKKIPGVAVELNHREKIFWPAS